MLRAMTASPQGEPEQELAKLKKRVPPADYEAFARPGRVEALDRMMKEALRQGPRGPVWDMRLYVREFDFELRDVRAPLKLFHGERDVNAPIEMVRRAVAELPDARLVTYENDAHLSTLCNHVDDFARALVGE